MSFATVMVHVDFDGASNARIRLAAELADRFGSDLIGICACILPPYPAEGAYFVTREVVERERRDIKASFARAEVAFRATSGVDRPGLEWRSDIELPDNYVASEARAADLLVVGRQAAEMDVTRSLDVGSVVLRAGRPVLVVPPNVDTPPAERVIIGWKDGREARRALRDALPFLHRAKAVTIVEIRDEASEDDGRRQVDDVVRYLARHKISVGSMIAAQPKGSVGDELIRLAKAEGADLIVAGAYGHSRLGEWVFGGVTRDLLASSPVCCLLAH